MHKNFFWIFTMIFFLKLCPQYKLLLKISWEIFQEFFFQKLLKKNPFGISHKIKEIPPGFFVCIIKIFNHRFCEFVRSEIRSQVHHCNHYTSFVPIPWGDYLKVYQGFFLSFRYSLPNGFKTSLKFSHNSDILLSLINCCINFCLHSSRNSFCNSFRNYFRYFS